MLSSFLDVLREELSEDEFKQYCRKFAKIMGEPYFEVLSPLYEEPPDLKPKKLGGTLETNDDHYKNIYDLIIKQANE